MPVAPLIGVGGVRTGRDALELVAAGRIRGAGRHRDVQRPVATPPGRRRARGRGRPPRLHPFRRRRRHRPREDRPPVTPTPFGVRLRAAMDAHGPLCVGIDPHRALLEAWGLPVDVSGLERFAMTCVEAFAGRVAVVKPQSGVLRGVRLAGCRGARAGARRPARERHDDDPRRQARRHRLDDGGLRAGVPLRRGAGPRRCPHGEPLPRLRVAAPRPRPRRRHRARGVRPRPDLEPRGTRGAARRGRRPVRRGIRRRRGRRRQRRGRRTRAAWGTSGSSWAPRWGMPSPASGSTSPPAPLRCSPRASAPRGPARATCGRSSATPRRTSCRTSRARCSSAGPSVAALTEAAAREAEAVRAAV